VEQDTKQARQQKVKHMQASGPAYLVRASRATGCPRRLGQVGVGPCMPDRRQAGRQSHSENEKEEEEEEEAGQGQGQGLVSLPKPITLVFTSMLSPIDGQRVPAEFCCKLI
jgi:hypothetical protein